MEALFAALPPIWQVALYVTILAFLVWNRTHSNKVSAAVAEVADSVFNVGLVAHKAAESAEVTVAAVTPNHGSSVADAVHRIEKALNLQAAQISDIEQKLLNHLATDTPCDHQPNSTDYSSVLDAWFDDVPTFPSITTENVVTG